MSRTLVVGDVHGCSRELDKLLRRVQPTHTLLVGDLFTKGPDPRGVWDLIKRWRADAVLGNHDEAVLDDWKPGKTLPKKALKWLAARPWMIERKHFVVVHAGVNPKKWQRTVKHEALHLREVGKAPWWKHYDGDKLIVHGHDAKRGLVDRREQGTLGLDTGCVAGGRLTGWVAEDDALVSVKAKRTYA